MTAGGGRPLGLRNGETRTFLEDGDTLILHGRCARAGARSIGFGECCGTVVAARSAQSRDADATALASGSR